MEGYPKLAALQGRNVELLIYRRFGALNARNLLYLQAELIDLEHQLNDYTLKDLGSNASPESKKYSRNWFKLSRSGVDGGDDIQWQTVLQIRAKLQEYNACLIQQQQLCSLKAPSLQDLAYLENWLEGKGQGECTLEGLDRQFLSDGTDLVAVMEPSSTDPLSRWIRGSVMDIYHRLIGVRIKLPVDVEAGIYKYSDEHVTRTVDAIATISSGLLCVLAIVILYAVSGMALKLGLVAVFTACFSLTLTLTTQARRIEVFAATTAFAAVQVVFVGSVTP